MIIIDCGIFSRNLGGGWPSTATHSWLLPFASRRPTGQGKMPSAAKAGSGMTALLLASCLLCDLVSGLPRAPGPPGSKVVPEQEPIMGIDYGSEWIKIGVITSGMQVRIHCPPGSLEGGRGGRGGSGGSGRRARDLGAVIRQKLERNPMLTVGPALHSGRHSPQRAERAQDPERPRFPGGRNGRADQIFC